MWNINLKDICDITINTKNNYLIILTGEYTQNLKIYSIDDRKLIYEVKTEYYMHRTSSKGDNAYIVTSNNLLLIFNLNTFEFERKIDLSLSGGIWSEENIEKVSILNDENNLLFHYSIFIEDDEDDYDEYYEDELLHKILLYNIEDNRNYILCENDDDIQDFRILNDNKIEFFDGICLFKAEVKIDEKGLRVINQINQENESNYNLLNEIHEFRLQIYEEKHFLSKAKIVLKDYEDNELFSRKTKYSSIRCYPIIIEEKDILILLITNQNENFSVYTFNVMKNAIKLLKETHYNVINIDGSSILNYTRQIGKVLLFERYNGAILLDLEDIM